MRTRDTTLSSVTGKRDGKSAIPNTDKHTGDEESEGEKKKKKNYI